MESYPTMSCPTQAMTQGVLENGQAAQLSLKTQRQLGPNLAVSPF